MEAKSFDWKDVANAQFEKAVALAVVLVLLGFLIAPRIELSNVQKPLDPTIVVVPFSPDVKDPIKDPVVKTPPVSFVIDPLQTEAASNRTDIENAINSVNKEVLKPTLVRVVSTLPDKFVKSEIEPIITHMVRPVYPAFARENNITGTVLLEVQVYSNGSLGNITVLESVIPSLDEAAITAIKNSTFQPGKSGGHAVNTTVQIPISFGLTSN